MALGFPIESLVAQKSIPKALYNWSSVNIAIPLVTKGVISNTGNHSKTFEGNIFVYHGNSGGPIISNNKLIGIISRMELDKKSIV